MYGSGALAKAKRLTRHRNEIHAVEHEGGGGKGEIDEGCSCRFGRIAAGRGIRRSERVGQKLQDRDDDERQPDKADDRADLPEGEIVGEANRLRDGNFDHACCPVRKPETLRGTLLPALVHETKNGISGHFGTAAGEAAAVESLPTAR